MPLLQVALALFSLGQYALGMRKVTRRGVADELPPHFGEGENTTHCQRGRGRTACPRWGDNYLATGGGVCKFRYTWHDGSGENTGSPVITTGSPVITSGSFNITTADLGKGTDTGRRTRDWVQSLAAVDKCFQDEAGHLLANNSGGCGTCPVNLFPQNRQGKEQAIDNCLAQGSFDLLPWKAFGEGKKASNKPEKQVSHRTVFALLCFAVSAVVHTVSSSWPSLIALRQAMSPPDSPGSSGTMTLR